MTNYKKSVKKRSLRYKNCKTHRRKGRKAGAGGTWHQKIRNFLGSRRARIHDVPERTPQQKRNNYELMREMTKAAHEDGSMLNRIGKFFPGRGRNSTRIEAPPTPPSPPPPPPPPRPLDGQSQSVFYYRSPRPDDPVSDWRDYGPIDTAISNLSLVRLAGGIADAMDTLSEKLDSALAKDLENSNSAELYDKYIDLLVAQYTNLKLLKKLVDKTSYFDKEPIIARKLVRYNHLVGKITAFDDEITALEDEIKKPTAEIDTSMRPVLSLYDGNSDDDDDYDV